ncbi:hypothetical protein Clacol_006707 [Clathrus columnatus]|uniref:Major facilitator superfamily (MFS) profile domain-containing protein n=1 Tax=Clathrus columnatus TaxID=1419009 RepID=A0AAV5ADJ6_9AGAM|nr:hypothetical protein Clacol_006707 [Clathrus columnatus]
MSSQSTTSLSFRGWQTALWILITSFQFGWQISALNQIQAVLTCSNKQLIPGVSTFPPCIPMSDFKFSVVTASFTVGGCVGSIAGNHVADVRGRKSSIRISAILVFLGAGLMTISSSVPPLVIGRSIIGFGSGLGLCAVPIYLSEIAPLSIKGSVGVLHQLGIVIGILVTQIAGLFLAAPSRWRFIPFIAAILSVVQFLCSSIAVDSPAWLSSKLRLSESKAAASTLWRSEVVHPERLDAERGEAEGLLSSASSSNTRTTADDATTNGSITWIHLVTPPLRRPFVVVSLAMAAQQLSGVNAVLYYSNNIFAGIIPNAAAYVSLGITVVNALMTFPPIYLVERIGRRSLLRLSALGSVISLFSIGYGINSGHVVFASIAVIIFIASFAIGLGPVPFIIISDITPFYAVSAVSSAAMALNWLSNFVVGLFFLPLRDLLANDDPSRKGSIFYVFGAVLLSLYLAWDKAYQAP